MYLFRLEWFISDLFGYAMLKVDADISSLRSGSKLTSLWMTWPWFECKYLH